MLVRERFKNYSKDHCWQYEIRLQNLEDDLKAIGLSKDEMEKLSIDDFLFSYVDKEDKELYQKTRVAWEYSEPTNSPLYSETKTEQCARRRGDYGDTKYIRQSFR